MTYAIRSEERLLVRLIAALQAEFGLPTVNIKGVAALLQYVVAAVPSLAALPITVSDLRNTLDRLERVGWVAVRSTNPHVSVALDGIVVCGPEALPDELVKVVESHLGKRHEFV